jgi:lysophospholipase L1-like esterase
MNFSQTTTCLLVAVNLLLCSCTVPNRNHINEADYRGIIRVACVGDSITYGHLIPNRDQNSYPAQLAVRLGAKWAVRNFGMNGSTALKRGTRPYWTQKVYEEALAFRPDVVILQLGTNDTAPANWQAHEAEFAADYANLLRSFASLESKPRLYVCRPVPIFRDHGKAWDTGQILKEKIIPRIDVAARHAKLPVIDLHATFEDKSALFPDGVHPNAEGAKLMAETIHAALTGRK